MSQAPDDRLAAGRAALARHAWREALEHLTAAEREGRLGAEELDGLAKA